MWLLCVRIRPPGIRSFTVPLPIIFLWPLLFLLGMLAAIVALPFAAVRTWQLCRQLVSALWHIGGLSVRIESRDGTEVLVRFI
jgi:hypothetical protein